jgi:hypothetical protein
MIEFSRLLRPDENVLLAQGVNEGAFDVQIIPETAEISMTNISNFRETMNELIFNSGKYDDPTALVLRKHAAVQTAVERLLGAPAGSIPIVDEESLIAWFVD